MSNRVRSFLPQLHGTPFLTDGGLETTLIHKNGYQLPCFAAFPLLADSAGRQQLSAYYRSYLAIADGFGFGFILETPTWRANRDWGFKLGYSPEDLRIFNLDAVNLLHELRCEHANWNDHIVLSGCLGPRDDGYGVGKKMTARQAMLYHREQIRTFAESQAQLVTAFTLNYAEEAIGIARAAQEVGMPSVIGFTVETDGRLPSGQLLGDAIHQVDGATRRGPAYYMINCAHPSHFEAALSCGRDWPQRIRCIRANASAKSHAELEASAELDEGDIAALGKVYARMACRHPHLNIFGGCCGTDQRHLKKIGRELAEVLPITI